MIFNITLMQIARMQEQEDGYRSRTATGPLHQSTYAPTAGEITIAGCYRLQ
jgi:hypothetical protein